MPLILALLMVGWVYAPLTRIYFVADDFSNMVTILNRGPLEFILQPFGGHMLMVRNTAFWLHHEMFGFDPTGYGWTALLTHLLNTWLFFRAGLGFAGSAPVAGLGALVWGTSPLLEGALGWYSVYGQVLSGTALLIVLDQISRWREARGPVKREQAALWVAALTAGATCFGVGIGIALAFPVAAALMLPRAARERQATAIVAGLPVVVVALYYGSRNLFGLFYEMPPVEDMMHGLAFSAFAPILLLLAHLLAVGSMGLVEGFWFNAFTYPASGYAMLTFFVAFLATAIACADDSRRRTIAGLLFLATAVYGFIALGRANVYAMFQVPMVDAGKTLRYHYAALIPLALAATLALSTVLRRLSPNGGAAPVAFGAGLAAVTLAYSSSSWRLDEHVGARAYVAEALGTIDATVDTVPAGDEVIIQNRAVPPVITGPMLGHDAVPGWAALFLLSDDDGVVRGRRVRFLQTEEQESLFRPLHPRLHKYFAPQGTPGAR